MLRNKTNVSIIQADVKRVTIVVTGDTRYVTTPHGFSETLTGEAGKRIFSRAVGRGTLTEIARVLIKWVKGIAGDPEFFNVPLQGGTKIRIERTARITVKTRGHQETRQLLLPK